MEFFTFLAWAMGPMMSKRKSAAIPVLKKCVRAVHLLVEGCGFESKVSWAAVGSTYVHSFNLSK